MDFLCDVKNIKIVDNSKQEINLWKVTYLKLYFHTCWCLINSSSILAWWTSSVFFNASSFSISTTSIFSCDCFYHVIKYYITFKTTWLDLFTNFKKSVPEMTQKLQNDENY